MPRTEVMRNPPGSGPGMMSFASAPITAPMRMIQTISSIAYCFCVVAQRLVLRNIHARTVQIPSRCCAPIERGARLSRFRRYAQHLADVDLVGVLEHRLVRLKDHHVLRCVAVLFLGDRRK